MSANLTVNHPIFQSGLSMNRMSTPLSELEDSSYLIILTQVSMMTASIEMKSSESEAPLRGRLVKAYLFIMHPSRQLTVHGQPRNATIT